MTKFPILIMGLAGIAFTYPAAAAPERSEHREETFAICAGRDRDAMNKIEERGEQQTVDAQKLADAMFSVMAARSACHEGRRDEAVEFYDAADRGVITTTGSR